MNEGSVVLERTVPLLRSPDSATLAICPGPEKGSPAYRVLPRSASPSPATASPPRSTSVTALVATSIRNSSLVNDCETTRCFPFSVATIPFTLNWPAVYGIVLVRSSHASAGSAAPEWISEAGIRHSTGRNESVTNRSPFLATAMSFRKPPVPVVNVRMREPVAAS